MLTAYIEQLIQGQDLSAQDMQAAFAVMLQSDNEAQVAALLAVLRAKGETVEEMYGLVTAMRQAMTSVNHGGVPVMDIVGTGGDGHHTINISTGSALLAASCGVRVAKHGNRSVSSLSGSADVLEALGVNIDLGPTEVAACLEAHGFGFCYAPNFHQSLGQLRTTRKRLGVMTVLNMVGPLLNPAHAELLMVGVAHPGSMSMVADVLARLNTERALVFHCEGLDELCCVAPVDVIEVMPKGRQQYQIDPCDYGFARCSISDLKGGNAQENAALLTAVLQGESGPIADTLVLNAGFACYLYGVVDSIEAGLALAKQKQQQGAGYALLQDVVSHTQQYGKFSEGVSA